MASPEPEPTPPRTTALGALVLVISSTLPLAPDGRSYLAMLLDELSRGLLEGLLMLIGFGSPYLFGLAVILGILWLPPRLARQIVRVPIAMMHSQLMLVALVLWRLGDAVAAVPLLGFATVSGVYMALHSARTFAEGDGPSLPWYVRWGAMVVAAVGGWCELQRLGGVELGLGLHVALSGALIMLVSMGGTSYRSAVPIRRGDDDGDQTWA